MAVQGWPRVLNWGDFRPIPRPPAGESEDASIEPRIDAPSQVTLTHDGDEVRLGKFDLRLVLAQGGSWVVRGRNTPSLLVHEQGHFDIAGLVAHENHRALEALRAKSEAELTQLVKATQQRMQAKLDTLTERYDRETNHSRNSSQQNAWNELIATSIRNGYRALPDR